MVRRVSHDEKLAFVCGGLSDQDIQAIREGRTPRDFEGVVSRVGLDGTTVRRILTDREALSALRLNPNRVGRAQLEAIPGMAAVRAQMVLDGRPYYTTSELEAATGLSPGLVDDLFSISPLRFLDKSRGTDVSLVPVPGRYLVPAPREFEEDPVPNIGYSELVSATPDFAFRVVQPLDFESPTPPHVLKQSFGGNVHPVLRDSAGFERYVVPGGLDVWFKPSVTEERRSSVIEELGLEVLRAVSSIGYCRAALKTWPDDRDVIRAVLDRIEQAQSFEEIRFCEPDYVGYEDFEPGTGNPAINDDLEAADRFWNQEAIKLDEAHAITRGSANVVVFIIDSGTRMDHEGLVPSFRPDWQQLDLNFDFGVPPEVTSPDERVISHGTKVAGVVRGMAPECSVLPVKISGEAVAPAYGLRAAAILHALTYLRDGDRAVLNLSWRTNGEHIGIREALIDAQAKGAVIAVSAGNYAPGEMQQPDKIHFPSAHSYLYPRLESLCSVGAVGPGDRKASYSYYGTNSITVAACGGESGGDGFGVYTTSTPEKYVFTQGTSFAAPQVAGLMALLLSKEPEISARDVIRIIRETADAVDDVNPAFTGMLGAGRVNSAAALMRLNGSRVHQIMASAGPHGTIAPYGSVIVADGKDQQFVIAPDIGYAVSRLLIDGVPVEVQSVFTFVNVSAAHSIEVVFAPDFVAGGSHYNEEGQLNINLATIEELCSLPSVGLWRAQRVVEHRNAHGPFLTIWGLAQTLVFDAWIIGQLEPYINV